MQAVYKRSFKLGSFGALAALVALGASAGSAEARSQSPSLGNPALGAHSTCFDHSSANGKITQKGGAAPCNGSSVWVMPIVYDNAGNHTISAAAHTVSNSSVSCFARSVDRWGASGRSGPSMTAKDGEIKLLQSTVNANGFGSTWMNCTMTPGTAITSLHY